MKLTKAIKSDLLATIQRKTVAKHNEPLRMASITFNDAIHAELVRCIGEERLQLGKKAVKELQCCISTPYHVRPPRSKRYHSFAICAPTRKGIELIPDLDMSPWHIALPMGTNFDNCVDQPTAERLRNLEEAMNAEKEKLIALLQEAEDLLAGINTDKQLADLWPEAAKLLTQQTVGNLPTQIPQRMREVLV